MKIYERISVKIQSIPGTKVCTQEEIDSGIVSQRIKYWTKWNKSGIDNRGGQICGAVTVSRRRGMLAGLDYEG